MDPAETKNIIKQNGFLYLTILVILFSLKLFYRKADSDSLQWLLAPTAWWVRALSGISFENIPRIGYVNHDLRFIIARSCSGFQFMLITASVLTFSFLHRMMDSYTARKLFSSHTHPKTYPRILYGFGCILVWFSVSYILTILVNGVRIILSIYLPLLLEQAAFFGKYDIYNGSLTPDRLHTLIGTVVYFASLLAIYQLADHVTSKISCPARCHANALSIRKLLQPAFWYFFFVLGIPLLNRAYANGPEQFGEYAALVIFGCTAVLAALLLSALPNIFKRRIKKHVTVQPPASLSRKY